MFWLKSVDGSYAPSDLAIVGFIGCDGTGTTTHTNHAVEFLESKNFNVQKEWMRFNHRTSLPILALARIFGMTEVYGEQDEQMVRAHRFEQSNLLPSIYKRTMLLDQQIMTYFSFNSIARETDVLVCDRFILDALVDLVVSTKDMDFIEDTVASQFWGLVPSQAVLIGLDCDSDTIVSRRSDVAQDPFLELRLKIYRELFQDRRIDVVDTSQHLESAKKQVEDILQKSYEAIQ